MDTKEAFFIGNEGYGDMIACIGIVNYLATKYQKVRVACIKRNYEQAKTFYNNKNIEIFVIDNIFVTSNL